jgi:hypothetical protein
MSSTRKTKASDILNDIKNARGNGHGHAPSRQSTTDSDQVKRLAGELKKLSNQLKELTKDSQEKNTEINNKVIVLQNITDGLKVNITDLKNTTNKLEQGFDETQTQLEDVSKDVENLALEHQRTVYDNLCGKKIPGSFHPVETNQVNLETHKMTNITSNDKIITCAIEIETLCNNIGGTTFDMNQDGTINSYTVNNGGDWVKQRTNFTYINITGYIENENNFLCDQESQVDGNYAICCVGSTNLLENQD